MQEIAHLAPESGPEAVADRLVRDGAVIVDRLAARERLERTRPHPEGSGRTGSIVERSAAGRELVLDPVALGASRRVIEQRAAPSPS